MTQIDLDAAVAAEIITAEQAEAMRRLPGASVTAPKASAERFQVARNFNEFFVAIGILILAAGAALFIGGTRVPPAWLIATAGAAGLAELVLRRNRHVLPGNILMALLPFSVFLGLGSGITGALGAAFAAVLCLERYRAPFSAFAAGLSLLVALFLVLDGKGNDPFSMGFSVTALIGGFALFAVAMTLDLNDPLRRRMHSQVAFWLHLLAAPLVVHSVMFSVYGPLFSRMAFPVPVLSHAQSAMTASGAAMILATVAVIGLVAIVIDRRALLVSSLGYLGAAVAYAMAAVGDRTNAAFATMFIIGTGVILLGLGWDSIRSAIVRRIPAKGFLRHLPPA